MAGIDVRMNYETMDKMAKAFSAAKQQLEETEKAVQRLGKNLEDGALQGEGGTAFKAAIDGPLMKALKKLDAKMGELSSDINGAISATRDGVKDAQSRFK
jgi:uncharacterized protein YukE